MFKVLVCIHTNAKAISTDGSEGLLLRGSLHSTHGPSRDIEVIPQFIEEEDFLQEALSEMVIVLVI